MSSASRRPSSFDLVRIYVAALIGVLLLVIFVFDLVGGGHSETHSSEARREVVTLSEYGLLSRAGTIEPTVYWIGRRQGTDRFELVKDWDGNVYVRYLTDDAAAGNRRSDSLTVASYPVGEAQQGLEHAARSEGEDLVHRDGFVALAPSDSHSAYVVFDDQPELQIEVYSPRSGKAASFVTSGAVTPLHWTPLD